MKYIIAICFLALSVMSCNTTTQKEEKIDFTKSYETAAMALTDAQLAYDAAVASQDSGRIADAKLQLEAAKTQYLKSKTYYTANGGIVNPEYEQLLAKTNVTLGKAPDDTTTVSQTGSIKYPETDVTKEPLSAAKKIIDSGAINAGRKIQQASEVITTSEKTIKQGVTKANENLTKVSDTTKKRIDELKKQANTFRNLFKKSADTSKQN